MSCSVSRPRRMSSREASSGIGGPEMGISTALSGPERKRKSKRRRKKGCDIGRWEMIGGAPPEKRRVPGRGLEPPPTYVDKNLNLARLPIPPPGRQLVQRFIGDPGLVFKASISAAAGAEMPAGGRSQ